MKHRIKLIIAHVRHLSRRKRNRVFGVIALINLILAFLVYSNLFTYPNTFMGKTDVSGKTAAQVRTLLVQQTNTNPVVQVKDRTYHYQYNRMGVVVDVHAEIDKLFAPNRKIFPLNFFAYINALFNRRIIDPPLVFTQQYDEFVSENTFDFSQSPDTVYIDPTTKSLVVQENSLIYRFDRENLKALLMDKFGSYVHPIYPMLVKVTNETIDQIADVNQRLAAIFSDPIMVYLDLGSTTQVVELKEEDIREATSVKLTPDNIHVSVTVNQEALNKVITKRVHASGFPIRNNFVTQNILDDFAKAVYLRFGGTPVSAVATTINGGPTTNGSLADKYIEVDISQAKMYLFQNGKVYKSYTVSTGLDYPTPVGRFEILNKIGLGYSNIYKNWLPWWMGFAYSKELNAYFGIHEQPYVLTADGKPIAASPLTIGTPSTGGCVALAPGAAREVYAFADVGTPVYIYN